MPAPTVLSDLAFLLEAREPPVEVVLLDAHLRREFGDRNSRLTLNEGECFRGARAAAFAPAGAAFGRAAGGFAGRFRLARWRCLRCCRRAGGRAPRTSGPAAADGLSRLRGSRP